MKVKAIETDYEPEQFTPFADYFKVFIDEETNEIIGCANIAYEFCGDLTSIYIYFIEAYGNGKGRAIIEHLLEENKYVAIRGVSLDDVTNFWTYIGADIDIDCSFVLYKENYRRK